MRKLLRITKKGERFSGYHRPSIGERLVFLPLKRLTKMIFVPEARVFDREEIFIGARCKVVGLKKHVIEVRFEGAVEDDLVSPEDLMTLELTEFGKMIFGDFDMSAELTNFLQEI